MKAKFKAAVFDLDGTLSNSIPCILHCSRLVHEKMGLPWNEAEQRRTISYPLADTAAQFCGPERVEEYLNAIREQNKIWLPKLLKPYPGAVELLQNLQTAGTLCALATSRQRYGTLISCETIGITPYLATIVAADQVTAHKPAAEPAEKALAALNVSPGNAVFIGDSPLDIACGQAAGMSTIAVSWGIGDRNKLAAAQPDFLCNTMAELNDYLLCAESSDYK